LPLAERVHKGVGEPLFHIELVQRPDVLQRCLPFERRPGCKPRRACSAAAAAAAAAATLAAKVPERVSIFVNKERLRPLLFVPRPLNEHFLNTICRIRWKP
jgi:hypothetical protein